MKISDLLRLTNIWNLADLDTGTKVLTLQVGGGEVPRLAAYFSGMFCAAIGTLRIEPGDVRFTKVSVSGSVLQHVLSAMPEDAAVKLSISKSSLVVRCVGGQQATLRMSPEEERPLIQVPKTGGSFEIDSADLRAALTFLRDIVAEGVSKMALTGVRFSRSGDKSLTLTATDGESRLGHVVLEQCKVSRKIDYIAKTADLLVGLEFFGRVKVTATEGQLYLSGSGARVRLSLLAGVFPSIARLPKTFDHSISIPAEALATARKVTGYLDSDGILKLQVADGKARFLVEGREVGSFVVAVGKAKAADIDLLLDARWLEPTASLGDTLKVQYSAANSPVLFSAEDRPWLYWLSPVTYG